MRRLTRLSSTGPTEPLGASSFRDDRVVDPQHDNRADDSDDNAPDVEASDAG